MANKTVKEIEIKLGGKAYTLRPSFQSYVETESKAGKPCLKMLMEFSKGQVGYKEVAAIIYGGMLGHNQNAGVPMGQWLSYEEIGELVYQEGLQDLMLKCVEYLSAGLVSDPEKKTIPQVGAAPTP